MIYKSSIVNGAKYFPLDELQNYLVFQLFISDFKTKNDKTGSWTSKGMSEESITPPSTTDECLYPEVLFNGKYDLKFKAICLK